MPLSSLSYPGPGMRTGILSVEPRWDAALAPPGNVLPGRHSTLPADDVASTRSSIASGAAGSTSASTMRTDARTARSAKARSSTSVTSSTVARRSGRRARPSTHLANRATVPHGAGRRAPPTTPRRAARRNLLLERQTQLQRQLVQVEELLEHNLAHRRGVKVPSKDDVPRMIS